MCGIAGVIRFDGRQASLATVRAMADAVAHRGPDGTGEAALGPVAFGHRRLAILDLSERGTQPMGDEAAQVTVNYNGEIYNYPELKAELTSRGHHFRSECDTEVVLRAYIEWGEAAFSRLNGHFACAVWDGKRRRLRLARDRFGVKPLYYREGAWGLAFGSEVKALLADPDYHRRVSLPALNEYFTFQNTLTDLTLFEGIRLLPAGTVLTADADSGRVTTTRYWDYAFARPPQHIEMEEASEQLFHLFERAVNRQLLSDVPIASYLSGGMDSSSITAVARRRLGRLRTFTMGFDLSSASGLELGYDERARAEALASRLKTEHYEMVLHAGDMEHVMPELIRHLEDLRVGQCYPNYYIAGLAGRFVKVVLSGVGGDELFGGYPWRYYRGLRGGPGGFYRSYYDFWQRLVPDEDKARLFQPDVWSQIADHSTFDVFRGVLEPAEMPLETRDDVINACLYFELKTFLNGLLVVEDKVSMAHGLETRAPFLDNDVVDFALSLAPSLKLANLGRVASHVDEDDTGKRLRYELETHDGKVVLRNAMEKVIPPDVTSGVKRGFSAPDASWFRGESIDYVNALLRAPDARINTFLQPGYVNQTLDEHSSGRLNHRLLIWSLLSFEWWLRTFLP